VISPKENNSSVQVLSMSTADISTSDGKKAVTMPANYGARCWNVGLQEEIASFGTGSVNTTDRKLRDSAANRSFRHLHAYPRGKSRGRCLKPCQSNKPFLDELYRRSPEIASSMVVAQEFFRIMKQRDLPAWAKWKQDAHQSPLASFVKHLCRDEAAVQAALQYKWSNGPVEGNVHRLKLIKRSMYGRANFDLLRLRVVHAA
jgi:transposase